MKVNYFLILLFITKGLYAEERIRIYVSSFIFEPMNKYTVEDVVKSSTFKIESSDVVFIEEVKGALGINKLAEMKDLRKKIEHFKIVFDIESGDNVKRYVSDGNIVCQIERDYCNKLDYELKDIFDPLYLIQLKD